MHKSIRVAKAFTLIAVGGIAAGCAMSPVGINEALGIDGEVGWVCNVSPNPFYYPGWIYSIAPSKARFDEGDISDKIQTKSDTMATATVSENRSYSLGFLAKSLDFQPVDLAGARAQAGLQRTFKVGIEIRKGQHRTSFADTRAAVAEWTKIFGLQDGYRYFVVRRSVATTDYRYRLDKDFTAYLGGEGNVRDILSVEGNQSCDYEEKGDAEGDAGDPQMANVDEGGKDPKGDNADQGVDAQECTRAFNFQSDGSLQIDERYAKPMQVCFLPEEIKVEKPNGMGGQEPIVTTSLVDDAEALFIDSVEATD